ncbi:hypothetical protein ASPZODRAFT_57705 [Penicilliopsis zonata CBS 506.65]|uniref:Ribosomal RNA processing protein n=1 Tax=Penicilliopsis zonata CBS 506.65 TaxID=1073090 RepID=A0A1L9SRJ1_9EURO|nr:hypothetical protein ASPZODRAFT_57705 [Penicilliopsis zonata CBS 506.65]OJJ49736.1 hypothetical protein ASPZODRAFT_57705 [Penicilliopsis zonata CBS 506.65]
MADIQKTPFVRELASSDRKTRDKAVESLTLFLRSRTDLSLLELLKLWKGLFFCFYHSDRPLTQQSLARSLSYSLVPTLPRATLHRFLRAFWITIGRDYHALDRLRLDKYLLLIRCYVGVAFEVFLKDGGSVETGKKRKRNGKMGNEKKKRTKTQKEGRGSSEGQEEKEEKEEEEKWSDLSSYLSILEEGPLCPVNFDPEAPKVSSEEEGLSIAMPHGPDGLRYHILDIWLDELEKVLEFEEDPETGRKAIKGGIPMELLLRPVEKLVRESPYKPVRTRAAETLEDERLVEWGVREKKESQSEEEEEESEEEWGGFD